MFEEIGLVIGQVFVLLFLGLGPVRIVLAWLPVAEGLSRQERRRVAWRITCVSLVMVVGLMIMGYFFVGNITPQKQWLGMGASIVLIVSSLVHRSPEPPVSDEPAFHRAMRMAIHPLAVPVMINPAGLGIILIVATFVRDGASYFLFFGLVLLMFFINFGLMVWLGRFHKEVPTAVTRLIGEVFAILLVSLGVFYIFRNLTELGLINLTL